jgi:hypothetical protein
MANRDLLKEAIADAKAVKETAIANAKAALEEAFAPRMQELLKAKLEEMDKDIEEAEEVTEGDDVYETEDNMEEAMGDTMEEAMDDKVEENEVDLEELLRELDELEEEDSVEETEKPVMEAEEEEAEEMEDTEEEEIDLENMSEDDLKKFIEDVIADMVEAGELEAGEGMEGEEEDEEEGEEEVEINERKKYGGNKGDVPAAKRGDKKDTAEEEGVEDYKKKKKMKENQEPVNEVIGTAALIVGALAALAGGAIAKTYKSFKDEQKAATEKMTAELIGKGVDPEQAVKQAVDQVGASMSAAPGSGKYAGAKGGFNPVSNLEEELDEAYNTIKTIKEELAEVNLFNAKLLYTNKIFKSKNLTESQKVKVLAAFDKAASVEEAKLVFETLSEGFTSKKAPMNESLIRGGASKAAGVATKKPIMEANDQVARWQKLAGIK